MCGARVLESAPVVIGACCLHLHLPGCASLKDKRGRLKSLLARLHREFNVAAAETGRQDVWQSAEISIVAVANDSSRVYSQLEGIVAWIERHRPELDIEASQIELR